MASNPPGACCVSRTLHEGEPAGSHTQVLDSAVYQVGQDNGDDRILVIVTDIHGYKFQNTLLIADQFAKAGYHVLIPDILNEDPVKDGDDLQEWLKSHTPEITAPIVQEFVSQVKAEFKPQTLVGIGYCFGAKYLIQLLGAQPLFDAGAVAHPSFVAIEEVAALTRPLLISAAETDPIFTTELRHETERVLAEGKKRYQIDLFSGVAHGYAVRGDISQPHVKYAKEKTFQDQVTWFSQY